MLLQFIQCVVHRPVAALFGKPLQAGFDAVAEKGLLLLDIPDAGPLFPVPLEKFVQGDQRPYDDSQAAQQLSQFMDVLNGNVNAQSPRYVMKIASPPVGRS